MSIFHQVNSTVINTAKSNENETGLQIDGYRDTSDSKQFDVDNSMAIDVERALGPPFISSPAVSEKRHLIQLLDAWSETPEGHALESLANKPRQGGFSRENAKYKSTFFDQFFSIFRRNIRNTIRDRSVIGFKLIQTLIFSLLFGMIYWKIPDRDQDAQIQASVLICGLLIALLTYSTRIQDRSGVLFFYVINLIMSNAMGKWRYPPVHTVI